MEDFHPFKSATAKDEYLAYYDERSRSWPLPFETRLVKTTFGETFVRIQGTTTGKPLILLPGDEENSPSWIPTIKSLSAVYRTYAVDHIFDLGRSVDRRPIQCPNNFVQWLKELFDALELDKASILGHSYGGWMASLFALAHFERIEKLVLLAPCATVLPPPPTLIIRAILYYFIRTEFVTRKYIYWYASDTVKTPNGRAIVEDMIKEQLLARKCYKHRKFVPPTVLTDQELQKLDEQIPTLFLIGENDVTYSAQKAVKRLKRVAPHIKAVICPGADHHVALVRPEWVTENVLEFLQSS